jgi:hypothetical protein
MITEVRALTETYLDGAGIFAYEPKVKGAGYKIVPILQRDRVADLSDLIHRVAEEIEHRSEQGLPPEPEPSEQLPVDLALLEPDREDPGE